jgi:hypothetical protein
MKIHAFVFNWKGYGAKAAALEKQLSSLTTTTVINSDEKERAHFPTWTHLDENAYFAEQWNTAIQKFNGDILFHIQADATFDNFAKLFDRATHCILEQNVGIFEPNIDFAGIPYQKSRLRAFAKNAYEIPMTDTTCWFVHGDIVRSFPPINLSVNKYGWGVAAVAAALCKKQNKLCVKDYSLTAFHPPGRGYLKSDAVNQRKAYINSLEPSLSQQAREVYRDVSQSHSWLFDWLKRLERLIK